MINVRIYRRGYAVSMEGHAGGQRNPEGHDLVCCAASALLYAYLATLQEMGVKVDHTGNLASGKQDGPARVRAFPIDSQRIGVMHRLQMLEDGLTYLAATYPECINIQF